MSAIHPETILYVTIAGMPVASALIALIRRAERPHQ